MTQFGSVGPLHLGLWSSGLSQWKHMVEEAAELIELGSERDQKKEFGIPQVLFTGMLPKT